MVVGQWTQTRHYTSTRPAELLDVARLLLDAGADPCECDDRKLAPIDMASGALRALFEEVVRERAIVAGFDDIKNAANAG